VEPSLASAQPPTFERLELMDLDVAELVTGDFNRDGKLDLASVRRGTLRLSLGKGDGTFVFFQDTEISQSLWNPLAADFNADGKLDLVVTRFYNDYLDNALVMLLGNGDGTFRRLPDQRGNTGVVADLNGDGKPDMVFEEIDQQIFWGSSLKALLKQGDETFDEAPDKLYGDFCGPLATGDLNGDGITDVVRSCAIYEGSYVLHGNSDGTFRPWQLA
jgi:VCBS repeat protein